MNDTAGYCFRARVRMGASVRIQSDDCDLTLSAPPSEDVCLRARDQDVALKDTRDVLLLGRAYPDQAAATAAAARWADALRLGLAAAHAGADFGARAPRSVLTAAGLQMLADASGQTVLNDRHDTMVFPCEPRPLFGSIGPMTGTVGTNAEQLAAATTAARQAEAVMSEAQRLAFDLYSASFSETSRDARFMMLMMAVETLIDPQPREQAVREHVEQLIAKTKAADLPAGEKQSIAGSLSWLHNQSIGQAGRQLARTLGIREYLDKDPVTFFNDCYDLRSALAHGYLPRPTPTTVGTHAANLQNFVGDLLALAASEATPQEQP